MGLEYDTGWVEGLEDPLTPVGEILSHVPAKQLMSVYSIASFDGLDQFLQHTAKAKGKLKKGRALDKELRNLERARTCHTSRMRLHAWRLAAVALLAVLAVGLTGLDALATGGPSDDHSTARQLLAAASAKSSNTFGWGKWGGSGWGGYGGYGGYGGGYRHNHHHHHGYYGGNNWGYNGAPNNNEKAAASNNGPGSYNYGFTPSWSGGQSFGRIWQPRG
eukprot:gene7383-7592_t